MTWESDHLVANSGTPVRLARGLALWAAGREAGEAELRAGAGQGSGQSVVAANKGLAIAPDLHLCLEFGTPPPGR